MYCLKRYTATAFYSFKGLQIPPLPLTRPKQNHQITSLPRESRPAGSDPAGPLRTCLVVLRLMGRKAEQQAQEALSGEGKIDGQRTQGDKRRQERKGSVAV